MWIILTEEKLDLEAIVYRIKLLFKLNSHSIGNELNACLVQWMNYGWVGKDADNKYCILQNTSVFVSTHQQPEPPAAKLLLLENGYSLQGKSFLLTIHSTKGSNYKPFLSRISALLNGFSQTTHSTDSTLNLIIDDQAIYMRANSEGWQSYEDPTQALSHCIQNFFRISAGDESHFITLHAGAVGLERSLLLPGISGAGKSTLCTLLSSLGWHYYGDDLIGLQVLPNGCGQIIPMPFAASIKQDSWGLLSENFPLLHEIETVSYGQKIAKFLPLPPPTRFDDGATILNAIIFPSYQKNSVLQTDTISTIEALTEFVNAGISLHPCTNLDEVQSFLELLCAIPIYKLQYSNIDQANAWLSSLAKN